jgi:predicted aspartyl protease
LKKFAFFILAILSTSSFLSFAKMEIVPLSKTEDGHLEMQASINGITATFVLDTGATGTVIDTNKLSVFGISTKQDKIVGLRIGDAQTGKVETFTLDIKQFSIGQKQLKIKSIYTNDSSGQFEPEVMGLIGYDALTELGAMLDVKNLRLLIPEDQNDIKEWLSKTTKNYETILMHKSALGFSLVDAQLGNNLVSLLVDTGTPELIFDETALTQFGFELVNHPKAKSVIAQGVELPMKVLKNGQIILGSRTLSDDFFTTDFSALMSAVNVTDKRRLIGILGNKHLAAMNAIIDVTNGKLYIGD